MKIEEMSEDMELEKPLSTGSKEIDKLLYGGIPRRALTLFFSQYDMGKTFLLYQIASKLYKDTGEKTLIIDTESTISNREKIRWLGFFKDRFNMDEIAPINFVYPETFNELYSLVGKGIDIIVKSRKKGKKAVRAQIWDEFELEQSELWRTLEKDNYGLLGFDSLSKPLKETIAVPPQQNMSTRSSICEGLLGRIDPIVKKQNLGCIVIAHESKNPADPYSTGTFFGPSIIGYDFKYAIQIRGKGRDPQVGEDRIIVRYRFPTEPSQRTKKSGIECKLAKDYGFRS